jgi:hypothetical protein
MNTVELWRPVASHPDRYEVSNLGRIRQLSARGKVRQSPRILTPKDNGHGYLGINLGPKGARVRHYMHRLVCESFNGPCPAGMECNHRNHDRKDNRAGNLYWASHSHNISNRRHSSGPAHSFATLRAWSTRRANAA